MIHIEKNICDNLVGTLLGIEGKSKDMDKARMDLEDLKIRKELRLKKVVNKKPIKPPTCYTLSPTEWKVFVCFYSQSNFLMDTLQIYLEM